MSLPRQKLSNFYELNGAIYIGKTADLKKAKTFFTANTLGYIMDDLYSIDIDEPDDLKMLEPKLRIGIFRGKCIYCSLRRY